MKGERYRDRIRIVKPTLTSNGRGGDDVVQTVIATVWARVAATTFRQDEELGGQVTPKSFYEVEILYSTRVSGLDPTHRVLWRDKVLNVFRTVVDERRLTITMQCEEVGV